jgi:hypothetical protein
MTCNAAHIVRRPRSGSDMLRYVLYAYHVAFCAWQGWLSAAYSSSVSLWCGPSRWPLRPWRWGPWPMSASLPSPALSRRACPAMSRCPTKRIPVTANAPQGCVHMGGPSPHF